MNQFDGYNGPELLRQAQAATKSTVDPESTPFADRKLGSFAMPIQWVEGMKNKDAEELFKHFRIVRAEIDYPSQSILYVAASEHFDPIPEGTMAPGYRIMVDHDGSKLSIRVAKI